MRYGLLQPIPADAVDDPNEVETFKMNAAILWKVHAATQGYAPAPDSLPSATLVRPNVEWSSYEDDDGNLIEYRTPWTIRVEGEVAISD